MATQRQTLANQRNAQLSTGPKTEEGKAASRRNALKHGLTGAGVVQPEADAALIEHRSQTWRKGYTLDSEQQEHLFERMIVASVRMTRCVEDELAVRTQTARRAQGSWDEDRRRDVERLAQRISKHPSLVVSELATTRQGCEWMLERWRALDTDVAWDEAQTALALDLLGVPPELRSLYRLGTDEPAAACARREIARLEQRLVEALIDLDEEERELAERGQELRPSRERLRLQRYEAAAVREYYKTFALLSAATAAPPVDVKPVETVVSEVPSPPTPPPAAAAASGVGGGCTLEELRSALSGKSTLTEVLDRFGSKTNPTGPYAGRGMVDVPVSCAGSTASRSARVLV